MPNSKSQELQLTSAHLEAVTTNLVPQVVHRTPCGEKNTAIYSMTTFQQLTYHKTANDRYLQLPDEFLPQGTLTQNISIFYNPKKIFFRAKSIKKYLRINLRNKFCVQ